jgi:phosphotransferase system  glucose/maltose/N-acetylglucosamine-specific IIC component
MLDSNAPLLGGLALFVLAASGGVAVLLLQNLEARKMMTLGSASLLGGVGLVVLALTRSEVALFFLATAVAALVASVFTSSYRVQAPASARRC